MLYLTAYKSGFPLFGPIFDIIVNLFGMLMNFIYVVIDKIGLPNVGIAIIVFTLITRIILYPSTVKQQKSSKIMNIIQPEIKAIQAKYEGQKDQQSMMAQQAEIRAVYEKYGTSMSGSCVQLLIQMPIILALYRVIMNIPAYVPLVKNKFVEIFDKIKNVPNLTQKIVDFSNANNNLLKSEVNEITKVVTESPEYANRVIDFLNKLNPMQMKAFADKIATTEEKVSNVVQSATNAIATASNVVASKVATASNAVKTVIDTAKSEEIMKSYDAVEKVNSFLGLNLSTAPSAYGFTFKGLIIPVLAAVSQYLSVVVMQNQTKKDSKLNGEPDQMQQTMKTMNIMMPLLSAWFCWQFASGIGIYWIASSIFMMFTYMIINKKFANVEVDELIKENIAKANKKRAKKGLAPLSETQVTKNIKNIEKNSERVLKEREEKLNKQKQKTEDSNNYYFGNDNSDSLFSKANMVQKYNERNNK